MALKQDFETFCDEIQLNNKADMESTAGEIAKKLNSHYYGLDKDVSSHLYIVGSVGRNTAIKDSSDLDLLFDLPQSVFKKYDAYETGGQSSLLQEVKDILKERYPNTKMRGDGQVVVIEFTKYTVELVPAFLQNDDRFKYPDTKDGGSWKYTDPLSEQEECKKCNKNSNGIYFDFCHIMRSWKNTIGFEFGGLLIDTLVYNHFKDKDNYKDSGYEDYLTILQNIYYYLKAQDKDQNYWLAVGSNQQVDNSGDGVFVSKANKASKRITDAIDAGDDINNVLRDLLGNDFPLNATTEKSCCATASRTYRNTEQFIKDFFPVDIRYSLQLDCRVSQDGWRDFFLREFLKAKGILRRNKKLDFFISKTDWKNCSMGIQTYHYNRFHV